MIANVYLNTRDGRILIPSVARTEAGYYLDVEPVEIGNVNDSASIALALNHVFERGVRLIPTPARSNFPKPVVLSHSSAKSYIAFEVESLVWCIEDVPSGGFQTQALKRSTTGSGFVPDPAGSTVLPNSDLNDAIQRFIEIVLSRCS